jgi:hypothetical protein
MAANDDAAIGMIGRPELNPVFPAVIVNPQDLGAPALGPDIDLPPIEKGEPGIAVCHSTTPCAVLIHERCHVLSYR